MRITRIYFKRTSRVWLMLSFLALGIGAGMIYKSQQYSTESQIAAQQRKNDIPDKKNELYDTLPRLSINSFSQLGYNVTVSFRDDKSKVYSSYDLISAGYRIDVKDACHVTILKKSYIQQITCEG